MTVGSVVFSLLLTGLYYAARKKNSPVFWAVTIVVFGAITVFSALGFVLSLVHLGLNLPALVAMAVCGFVTYRCLDESGMKRKFFGRGGRR